MLVIGNEEIQFYGLTANLAMMIVLCLVCQIDRHHSLATVVFPLSV
jgi:hypothetical protein